MSSDRKKWEDLIFQNIEEKELLQKKAQEHVELTVESLTDTIMKFRRAAGKSVTEEQARARAVRILEED